MSIERENLVLRLKSYGFNHEQIIDQIGEKKYEWADVSRDLKNAIVRFGEENNQDVHTKRSIEIRRYDEYLKSLHRRIDKGDIRSIEVALKISIERNKILGLYMPVEVKINQLVEDRLNREIELFLVQLEESDRMDIETMKLIREIVEESV